MKTVELSAALGQAQVVENLKNFVGVDAQGAAALMTPERLAAVAGGFLWSNNAHISNVNECLESGYYVASHNSKGLPVEVGECPLIVFKISAQSAVQFIAYKNEVYVRIYWIGSFLGWRKFIGSGVLKQK